MSLYIKNSKIGSVKPYWIKWPCLKTQMMLAFAMYQTYTGNCSKIEFGALLLGQCSLSKWLNQIIMADHNCRLSPHLPCTESTHSIIDSNVYSEPCDSVLRKLLETLKTFHMSLGKKSCEQLKEREGNCQGNQALQHWKCDRCLQAHWDQSGQHRKTGFIATFAKERLRSAWTCVDSRTDGV